MTALLVAAGAAVGAPLRFVVGRWLDGRLPWGTLLVNVIGSFLLGIFSAMSLSQSLGDHAYALLATGFCGAFTTYSSFAVQVHDHGARPGTAYVVLTLVGSLAACAVGFVIG